MWNWLGWWLGMGLNRTDTDHIGPFPVGILRKDCGMLSKCCVQTIGHFFQASMRYRFSNSRLNSLTPGWCGSKFKTVISKHVLWIKFMPFLWNCCRWTLQDLTDDQSTLFQVMAWCRQAPSHYLNQCWPSPMTPYGVTRPQWVLKKLSNKHVDGCTWMRSHFQSVPRIIHTCQFVVFCCDFFCMCVIWFWSILSICFRITSLTHIR